MALCAADFDEPEPPLLDAGCGRWLCRRLRRQGRAAQCSGTHDADDEERLHQRGCVTTSTSAGWPRLTAAIARASDGPRSFGLAIGPSAYHAHCLRELRVVDRRVVDLVADVRAIDATIARDSPCAAGASSLRGRLRLLCTTERIGILWCAAVQSTPGAYIMSPSFWMFTERRPYFRLASAAPIARGHAVANPRPAGHADVLVVLVEVPQPLRPSAQVAVDERPVFVPNLFPHFRREARGADRRASHAYAASVRARSSVARLASASFAPRASNARRRSGVINRRTASINAGSVASPSPAMARSVSVYRWKSW